MSNLRLFISQPMQGKTEEEIRNTRLGILAVVENMYSDKDVYLAPSYFIDAEIKHPLEYLGMSLSVMSTCDLVVFAKDWQYARGCKIEHLCAEEYQIPYLEDMEYTMED